MDTDRIKGAAQQVGGKVQRAVGEVADDPELQGEGVVRQVAGKAQNIYGQVKDSLPDVADAAASYAGKAQDIYGQVKDNLPDVADTAASYAGTAYDRGDQYARRGISLARREIETYPMSAVILAGTVGYLLAMLLHGRR